MYNEVYRIIRDGAVEDMKDSISLGKSGKVACRQAVKCIEALQGDMNIEKEKGLAIDYLESFYLLNYAGGVKRENVAKRDEFRGEGIC